MECTKLQKKLGAYLDNEVAPAERAAIESHLQACPHCASEKKALAGLTTMLKAIPDLVPAESAEHMFWEKVRQPRKHRFIEKIWAVISQWDLVPFYYPATIVLLLGLVTGIALDKVINVPSTQGRPRAPVVEYLALNRMDTISYHSFAGVYQAGIKNQESIDLE